MQNKIDNASYKNIIGKQKLNISWDRYRVYDGTMVI